MRWNPKEYSEGLSFGVFWRGTERLPDGGAPRHQECARDGRGYS